MNRRFLSILATGVAYWATGKLSLLLIIPPGQAAIVWLPAGASLVAVLLTRYRAWPGVLLGSVMLIDTDALMSAASGHEVAQLATARVCISLGATLQALFGAYLIRRYVGTPGQLDNARDIILFLLLGGPVACLINSLLAPTCLVFTGAYGWSVLGGEVWEWWVGDTLGTITVAPPLLAFLAQPQEVWRPRRLSLGGPFAGIIALTLILFFVAAVRDRERQQRDLQLQAVHIADDFILQLQICLQGIHGFANLLRVVDNVDRNTLVQAAASLLASTPGAHALAWMPKVTHGSRVLFEQSQIDQSVAGFRIFERGPDSSAIPARDRAVYYPVSVVATIDGDTSVLGYDMASDALQRAAIERAIRAEDLVATRLVYPVREDAAQNVWVVLPVYKDEYCPEIAAPCSRVLLGIASGAFRVGDLVEAVLGQVRSDDQRDHEGLAIRVKEETKSGLTQLLYERSEGVEADFRAVQEREMMGRRWVIEVAPTQQRLQAQGGWQTPAVLSAGLVFSAVFSTLLLLVTGNAARIAVQARAQAEELSQAQLALRQTEFFRRLADANVVGILRLDLEGQVLDANDAFLDMLGYTRADFDEGRVPWERLTPPEWESSNRRALAQLREHGVAPAWEREYVHRDGSRVPVVLGGTRLDGAKKRCVACVVDLTAVKEARAEAQRYQVIIDNAPIAVFAKEYSADRQGVYILNNTASFNLTGCDVVGRTDAELFPQDIADQFAADDEKVLQAGTAMIFEDQIRDVETGTTSHLLTTKLPLFDETGTPYAVAGISLDVTKHKRLSERMAGLLNAIPDLLLRMNRDGIFLDYQNNLDHNITIATDRIIGASVDETFPSEDLRQRCHKAIADALDTGKLQQLEYNLETPAGVRYYEARIVKSGADEVFAFIRDITESKQNREALQAANTKLKFANEELREFAYVASHDLQEPLRTIGGFVELLSRRYPGAFDDQGRKWLGLIVSGTQRMRALIDDLLVYSRVGRSGHIRTIDTGALVAEILADFHASIDLAGAEIHTGALPEVVANETELRLVFQNLISNALKFRRLDGTCLVTVAAERIADEWVFSVSDNGIGIEPEYHERIFQVFQRLHTRSQYPGTGIGLALVKKIVERQGGRLSLRSAPGEGSEFSFTIPATATAVSKLDSGPAHV